MTYVRSSECAQCGAPLEIPAGKTPTVTFVGRSGKPNERVLLVDGHEIHRCLSVSSVDPLSTGRRAGLESRAVG